MKTCVTCKIGKPFSDFYRKTRSSDGYQPHCKICDKVKLDLYRAKNLEKFRTRNLEWKNANPEKQVESHAKWRSKPENKVKVREIGRRWLIENRSRAAARVAKRRAAKLQATPPWADKEKVAEFYFAADFLGMVTGEWYHVDHIVPLQSEVVCGLHWEGNLQVLTAAENLSKQNRHWPDMPE